MPDEPVDEVTTPKPVSGVSKETETPTETQSVPAGTTEEKVSDASSEAGSEKLADDLNTKLEQTKVQFERDIAGVKSSLQSRESELRKDWDAERTSLEQQVHDARMSVLDDDQKAAYEAQVLEQKVRDLDQRNQQLEQQIQQESQKAEYIQFFTQAGVPAEKLDTTDLYALYNSGWAAMSQELQSLRQQVADGSNQPSPTKPAVKSAAPQVQTQTGQVPQKTWGPLIEKYKSKEGVYKAIEQGRLDPSILPD